MVGMLRKRGLVGWWRVESRERDSGGTTERVVLAAMMTKWQAFLFRLDLGEGGGGAAVEVGSEGVGQRNLTTKKSMRPVLKKMNKRGERERERERENCASRVVEHVLTKVLQAKGVARRI